MIRKLAITIFALLVAVPAFPDVREAPNRHVYPALHVMSNSEFALFLRRLDTGALRWKVQLGHVSIRSLGLDQQETEILERNYNQCLQSLDNTHDEIQELSQKQTLQVDVLLLVDLNDLARNLDGFNRDLANVTELGSPTAQKSLGYAREVFGIDAALAPLISEFQHHILAFARVIDAAADRTEYGVDQPQTEN
jgi:hypothetical protein